MVYRTMVTITSNDSLQCGYAGSNVTPEEFKTEKYTTIIKQFKLYLVYCFHIIFLKRLIRMTILYMSAWENDFF